MLKNLSVASTPRWLFVENRIKELNRMIVNNVDKNLCIPPTWVAEYNRLVVEQKNNR